MFDSFKLTVVSPATIKRTGKTQQLLDLSLRIEDELVNDTVHLNVSARYNADSNLARLNGFFFPLSLNVRVIDEEKTKQSVGVSFWCRDDKRCLVMVGFTNRREDNFEGDYDDALTWTIGKIKEKIHSQISV